jgi:hypothetical protein
LTYGVVYLGVSSRMGIMKSYRAVADAVARGKSAERTTITNLHGRRSRNRQTGWNHVA